ncbi:MAG: Glu/Leu/Phe/Val dehydrogenase dimerization domain-containing protein [Flavobacteriales bacterium]|nr:Glu/Leu/Phe/Val dehydrogenase dimerization domain-containing protein [Flavobacteriales bacterium]
MKKLLDQYENKKPEIVFEWSDSETEAEGWVVINSLRGGAAGGGTRMRKGLNKHEVVSLAKTMEVKFTVAGPAIGGAKSGINFDPKDPRKEGVLERWYAAITPLLKNYYGTGGDLNVDEIHEVIPITKNLGVEHPQEGVFTGHFKPSSAEKSKIIKQLQDGVLLEITNPSLTPDVSRKYTVADMITGFGVSEAVKHFYHLHNENLTDKKVIIQGWGNVGSAAAFYQASEGAKVVGIIDQEGGLIKEEGFTFEEIRTLFLNKNGNKLSSEKMLSFEDVNSKIWDIDVDIFIPAAASRLVNKDHLERMIARGLEVISCGANVPFADKEIFFGTIGEFADERVSVLPDFIANCGMARVFAFLMNPNIEMNDTSIFDDTSTTILNALKESHKINSSKTEISKTAFEIALNQLI